MTARRHSLNWGAITAAGLRLLGWLALNALAAAGIMALATFALGSFSLPLTMVQLANLADRYVVAGAARQSQFDHIVLWAFAALFAGVSFFRRAGLAAALSPVEPDHG
jgi:hypothetical protein